MSKVLIDNSTISSVQRALGKAHLKDPALLDILNKNEDSELVQIASSLKRMTGLGRKADLRCNCSTL